MRWSARFQSTWQWLFQRGRNEAELDDEFRSHLEQEIENKIRSGMPRDEATLAAQRLLGSVSLYKEECRDARRAGLRDAFVRDFRYSVRTLRRTPLFTAIAIITLALGIGANTTIFTFIENILLRSLPVPNPQQLVSLNWGSGVNMSYPNYVDFRDRNSVFSGLVAYRYNPVSLSIRTRDNSRIWGYEASGNYFQTLGIQPALGRFFGPSEDDKPGAHPVLMISYSYWRSRFSADSRIIGREVRVNGFPFTIIGVAPRGFSGSELIMSADYWAPMCMFAQIEPGADWLRSRAAGNIWTLGRLKPGVSPAQAEQNLDVIARDLARAYPDLLDGKAQFYLTAPGLIGQALRKPATGFGIVLMSLAAAGLLLACANLAGMFLARASDRGREVGIRLALGASRGQLLRQFLTESLLLALGGGLLGFLLAEAACRLISAWHPALDIPIDTALHPDSAVLCFALIIAVATTFFFGLAPALQAMRTDVIPTLKNEPVAGVHRKWRLRDFLVTGQLALSVVLVVSSLLVVRSLQHALSLNLGFNPANAVSISFDLHLVRYSEAQSRRFDAALVAKTSALPGVQSAGIINTLPLSLGGENNSVVSRVDRPIPKPADRIGAVTYNITPGYLRAAGTHLLSGRDVNRYDRQGAPPVTIVNEALANAFFGKENPLGKRVRLSVSPADPGLEIVGVTETGKYEYLGEDPKPVIFLPVAQTGTGWTTLVVRSSLPPQTALRLLRKTILDLDPELTVFDASSLTEQLSLPLFPARIAAIALGVFGLLALVLAATGLFALMAYAVSRRTQEIGIRMALGAQPVQVLRSLFLRTFILCGAGILIGTVITLLAARLLSAVLYGVSPRDPATYLVALIVLLAVALLAAWHPAARAVHTDPASTLREQ